MNMRDRFLVVIGCQKEKLDQIDKKNKNMILDYINANSDQYTGVISIVRKPTNGDDNFRKYADAMSNNEVYLEYQSDNIIIVPGYDVDCNMFRKDAEYHIIGISTSASVLCISMSMFSVGLNIKVLEKYCEDRKGKDLEKYAFAIMKAYMPGVLI